MAEADLADIWLYGFTEWSRAQADSYHRALVAAFERIAQNPALGRRSRVDENYRQYPSGSHIIFYRITDRDIHVVRVLHASMDADSRLP